jgi:hypothetical protein
MRRLLAIGFIWLCCAVAWTILGSTLLHRSSAWSDGLGAEVQALWGPPLQQAPPVATGTETHAVAKVVETYDAKLGRAVKSQATEDVTTTRPLTLTGSDLGVSLALEHRRKGLLWFPTYGVTFRGTYVFRNDTAEARQLDGGFPLEAGVTYDGFRVTGPDGKPVEAVFDQGGAHFRGALGPGAEQRYTVSYRTRGTWRWGYGVHDKGLGPEPGRVRNFKLKLETDFAEVDFPAGTVSPSAHRAGGGRWSGTWDFEQLVGTPTIGLVLPQRLNPGPLAASITLFAPVSLLFFFFVVGVVLAARRAAIHPVNYFLLACAFFAFHLLFAYLIDHISIAAAFAGASAVSLALVVSYARLFVGWRSAVSVFGVSQLIYLVLFSVSFFWEGYTGLAITVGAVLTLFVMMQLTGRLDWAEVLGSRGADPTPARSA